MSMSEELKKLSGLYESGVLTEQEYHQAKQAVIFNTQSSNPSEDRSLDDVQIVKDEERGWSCAIHLSQTCGYFFPLLGLIVPVVIWQIKKSDNPIYDAHGKIVFNWLMSALIYAILFGFIVFLLIINSGIFFRSSNVFEFVVRAVTLPPQTLSKMGLVVPVSAFMAVSWLLFPIIGAIQARNGKVWRYPFSISFLTVPE